MFLSLAHNLERQALGAGETPVAADMRGGASHNAPAFRHV